MNYKEKCWEILRKTRKPILAFWSMKFQIFWIWKTNEPILERGYIGQQHNT